LPSIHCTRRTASRSGILLAGAVIAVVSVRKARPAEQVAGPAGGAT
jgi:hypothetical protein